MSNQVYANNMEVSCKAAAGKSICAFPDVCMTPPQTPATPPGVPIPYPNTGMASDTSDGSTSVKVSGQEVMLKNKSYFKQSTGDEAGAAPIKGVLTHKNNGKVYFTAWSMDVKVEDENVVRMMDLTTHNHASLPGNTPTWPYLDEAAIVTDPNNPCKDTFENVKAKCQKHVDANTYSSGRVNMTGARSSICTDKDKGGCKEAMRCVLSQYKESQRTCCEGSDGKKMTPHHIIPAHCFMPPGERAEGGTERYEGCQGYDPEEAPCICVEGEGKEKDHGKIHDLVDDLEDTKLVNGQAGSWTYGEAATAGVMSAGEVTGCDEKCMRQQVDAYHQQKTGTPNVSNDTKLRADSTGNRTLSAEVPKIAPGNTPSGCAPD